MPTAYFTCTGGTRDADQNASIKAAKKVSKVTPATPASILDAETLARRQADSKRHSNLAAVQAAELKEKQQREAGETERRLADATAAAAKLKEAANPTLAANVVAPAPTGTLHKPAAKPGAASRIAVPSIPRRSSLRSNAHPAFWAPFSLVGDGGAH